jgi:hypothetical protein
LAPFHPASLRSGTRHFASYEHQNFLNISPGIRPCSRSYVSAATGFQPGYPSTPAPTLIGCEFLKNRPGSIAEASKFTSEEARLYIVFGVGQHPLERPGTGGRLTPALRVATGRILCQRRRDAVPRTPERQPK